MTIPELFALPVGQRLWWESHDVGGEVTVRDAEGLYIVWDDGQHCIVAPDDDDLMEFAAWLERVDEPTPDQPVVVERRN
jgi:hypothetical protein